ncbi:porin [Turicimonas muris]|uniref:porin n=1 Tax=Turicimonas muris TaxID=1796652 RepID=UPI002494087C|nr:porin [Turicimonas muris]
MSGLSNKILTFCLLCAVPTVYAQSTVSVYGVVDTGFGVMKGKGQQTSVQAVSGGNAASRWGLTGKEELGSGNYVKFILEQGIKVNNGAPQTAGVLFDRDSLLLVGGKWGELGFGRSGSLMGTTGYFGQFPKMGANPMASNFLDAALIGSLVNSGMLNNSVTYQVKPTNSVTLTAQYSNGISSDEDTWSKNNHYYGLSAQYKQADFSVGTVFTVIDYRKAGANNGADSEPTYNLFLTAYKMFGQFRLNLGYQHVWNSRNLSGGPNAFYAKDLGFGTAAKVKESRKGFRSDSFVIGGSYPVGGGKLFGAFKWNMGKWHGESMKTDADRDGDRWVASLKYLYPLSKRTSLYAVGSYARGTGMFKNAESKATRLTTAFGVCHNF